MPIAISGTISYCSNPVFDPVPTVTINLAGSATTSTLTDISGNYLFSFLASGGSYTVTPAKSALPPVSAGINTIDIVATQRHFLIIGTPLTGCQLTAANVNGDTGVNTIDVIAMQRFFLILPTGFANVGQYSFSPASRTCPGAVTNQTGQNFEALIFGDVVSPFADRPDGVSQDASDRELNVSTVAEVGLPAVAVNQSRNYFIAPVTTSPINRNNGLVGFQGDFIFDERVVTFESEPVQRAGLTGGSWNVSGNVLPGAGPIRTLRISAFSNDFKPLSGRGTLFELRIGRVNKTKQGTQLIWAQPPDHFIFIDADLNTQRPARAAPGRF